ncbi:MAG: ATP-dependent protease ATPase subunit HslU [Nitrospirota bacterium]
MTQTAAHHELTPAETVAALDKYIIGQHEAKRAVALAIRDRWRRQRLDEEMRAEVIPKNIVMIGPTGVGKTEISRRIASLTDAPFIKVEASKFTEVGYVGRDVESIIRDLTELAINMVTGEATAQVEAQAAAAAEERLLDALLPPLRASSSEAMEGDIEVAGQATAETQKRTREKLRERLNAGHFDDREIEVTVESTGGPNIEVLGGAGIEEMGINIKEMLGGMFPKRSHHKRVKVSEARHILREQEAARLVDKEKVHDEALRRVQESGIVFVDEIDKVAGRGGSQGPDVSREGVQRDILPIVEGTTVVTKYGPVKTDHILFIAAGAFHVAKPSDLIPELQGRFPIRVKLDSLDARDFVRILTEPKNALTRQYRAMLATEEVDLQFTDEAIHELARIAALANERNENTGARRLYTVMERLLADLSFDAPGRSGEEVIVDAAYVTHALADVIEDQDLSRYIL